MAETYTAFFGIDDAEEYIEELEEDEWLKDNYVKDRDFLLQGVPNDEFLEFGYHSARGRSRFQSIFETDLKLENPVKISLGYGNDPIIKVQNRNKIIGGLGWADLDVENRNQFYGLLDEDKEWRKNSIIRTLLSPRTF